jgi:hypothetical protein
MTAAKKSHALLYHMKKQSLTVIPKGEQQKKENGNAGVITS